MNQAILLRDLLYKLLITCINGTDRLDPYLVEEYLKLIAQTGVVRDLSKEAEVIYHSDFYAKMDLQNAVEKAKYGIGDKVSIQSPNLTYAGEIVRIVNIGSQIIAYAIMGEGVTKKGNPITDTMSPIPEEFLTPIES